MFTIRQLLIACALYQICAQQSTGAQEPNSSFGSVTNPGSALIGIFCDFKQTQKRNPTFPKYWDILHAFIKSNWDENVLSPYFRSARPVYATQIFVPYMGASAAPDAFGLKDIIEPTQWIVIYKGQVSPPEDGTYRFVGVADNVLAVAVNRKTVLVSSYAARASDTCPWQPPEPRAAIPGGPLTMQRGDWFYASKGKPLDFDGLIGEEPGGDFGAWLLIEKKGQEYPVIDDPRFGKRTVLPLFQVARQTVNTKSQPVPFSTDGPVWICHQ